MGRPRRVDLIGSWHHAWGRGIAKKPIFENRQDIRRFLAALARAVRRGDLEVHSFVFLTTHFHLLVRSPRGNLSSALGRVLWDFTHHYNRCRDRDGTVWRARFCSKCVETRRYRRILVRYIDQNPVKAGLAAVPWRYEHGSAQRFIFRTPKWLSRSWIDEEIRVRTGKDPKEGGRYEDAFPLAGEMCVRLVDAREASCATGPDPLDDLLAAAPEAVRRWLVERSQLADATRPGHPIVDPVTVSDLIAQVERERPGWRVRPGRKRIDGSRVLGVALLRDLAGQTYSSIGRRIAISIPYVKTLYRDHKMLMSRDPDYGSALLEVTLRALSGEVE